MVQESMLQHPLHAEFLQIEGNLLVTIKNTRKRICFNSVCNLMQFRWYDINKKGGQKITHR